MCVCVLIRGWVFIKNLTVYIYIYIFCVKHKSANFVIRNLVFQS